MNCYLGLDLSFTGTGLYLISDDKTVNIERYITTDTKDNWTDDISRIVFIADQIFDIIKDYDIKLVAIESYFTGVGNSQVGLRLASLGTLVRYLLTQKGYSYFDVSPTQNKKFITGSGTSQKDQIQMYVLKKYNVMTKNNNTADAFGFANIAMAFHQFKLQGKNPEFKYEQEVIKSLDEKVKVISKITRFDELDNKKNLKKKNKEK